ncbi:MAG: heme lyase CcmF/NrfE family subunit, partial [Nitrospinota bacterium]
MAEVGHYALLTALFLSAYSALISLLGVKARRGDFISSGERAAFAATGLLTVASLALCYLLLRKDFSIEYVASHVNRSLPFFYTLSAFWAGQKGSLLL